MIGSYGDDVYETYVPRKILFITPSSPFHLLFRTIEKSRSSLDMETRSVLEYGGGTVVSGYDDGSAVSGAGRSRAGNRSGAGPPSPDVS